MARSKMEKWIGEANCINRVRRNRIRLAAEVAGLTFGKDVIVKF
jgi:hypothetical protein